MSTKRPFVPKLWPLSRIARRMLTPSRSRPREPRVLRRYCRVAWPAAAHTTISKIWSSLRPVATTAAMSVSVTV